MKMTRRVFALLAGAGIVGTVASAAASTVRESESDSQGSSQQGADPERLFFSVYLREGSEGPEVNQVLVSRVRRDKQERKSYPAEFQEAGADVRLMIEKELIPPTTCRVSYWKYGARIQTKSIAWSVPGFGPV